MADKKMPKAAPKKPTTNTDAIDLKAVAAAQNKISKGAAKKK